MIWWVIFEDREPGCVDHGTEEQARLVASTHGKVKLMQKLPYPAHPRLAPLESQCPSFCYTPGQCANAYGGSCRKNPSCSS